MPMIRGIQGLHTGWVGKKQLKDISVPMEMFTPINILMLRARRDKGLRKRSVVQLQAMPNEVIYVINEDGLVCASIPELVEGIDFKILRV